MIDSDYNHLIGSFATGCEQLNEYARSLTNSGTYDDVRTGSDIRHYRTGWRVEKWVEALLDRNEGLWAVWWMEFGPCDSGWVIQTHVSVSPDVFYYQLQEVIIGDPSAAELKIAGAVTELMEATQNCRHFSEAILKWKKL